MTKSAGIVIAKASKGNVTVCMDKSTCEQKAASLLEAPSFRKMLKDRTKAIERKINKQLKVLFEKGKIENDVYNRLTVSQNCTRPAIFYGLPKIHKKMYRFDQ